MIEKQSKVQMKAGNILLNLIPNNSIGVFKWPPATLLIYPYPQSVFADKLCTNTLFSWVLMVNVGVFDINKIKFT